jgi:hypothetical protein
MMMTNPTTAASSATTAKLIRKPVVRHMVQKDRPPSVSQRDGSGNFEHVPVDDAQRRWRPMLSVTVPPVGDCTV